MDYIDRISTSETIRRSTGPSAFDRIALGRDPLRRPLLDERASSVSRQYTLKVFKSKGLADPGQPTGWHFCAKRRRPVGCFRDVTPQQTPEASANTHSMPTCEQTGYCDDNGKAIKTTMCLTQKPRPESIGAEAPQETINSVAGVDNTGTANHCWTANAVAILTVKIYTDTTSVLAESRQGRLGHSFGHGDTSRRHWLAKRWCR